MVITDSWCIILTMSDEIIRILVLAGEKGMKLSKLVTHVYNSRRSFFDAPDYDVLYVEVKQTVLRLSKSQSSIIEPADVRGYYRINPDKLSQYGQLTIDFDNPLSSLYKDDSDEFSDNDGIDTTPDLSLSLFD